MLTQVDLEDLVQRCRSANARAYIKEAVDCYRIGAYRACVITTWIALIYDFVDKLRELSLAGDSSAMKRVAEFDEVQKTRNTDAALKFEREALVMAKDEFELITVQEMSDLGRLFEDRNRCGHPNLNREDEVYTPPPELARLHLRLVIEHVLERPPVQGKAALASLRQSVDSDYFPVSVDAAEHVLRATPLPRAKRNVVREFILGALVSLIREVLPEKRMFQRVAAVQVAQRLHPDIGKAVLEEKFDSAVFKTPDDCFIRALWLLVKLPDLQHLLKSATWVKVESFVSTMPTKDVAAVAYAFQVSRLRELALKRLLQCDPAELAVIVRNWRGKPDAAVIECCVTAYANAGSWDGANFMAKELIQPLIQYMDSDQAKAVIYAGVNGEVRSSRQFPNVAFSIKSAGILTDEGLSEILMIDAALRATLAHLLMDGSTGP